MHLLDLVASEEYHHFTALCYDDGRRKVYVTYRHLLECSLALASNLREHVKIGKV